MKRAKAKFRVGQWVLIKNAHGEKKVKLLARDRDLPKLWFYCSDGYLHRITDMRRRERGDR